MDLQVSLRQKNFETFIDMLGEGSALMEYDIAVWWTPTDV